MKALFVFCLLFLSAAQEALGRTTIEVPIFEGGCGLTFFFEAARSYEEARPDVLVDLYGDPRIADKIRVRVLEGTYPEVTNAGLNYWALIRNGQVQPLDEYLDGPNWEGDKTWRQSFLPGSLDRFQYQGKTYGIPFLYVVYAVWYNKNMFAEHGWEPARTWDEFFALCEQIKAAGIPPLAFQGRYPGYAGAVVDNSYYHLAGRERYYQQKDLIPGSFANPEFEQALSFIQRTAQNYFQLGALGMSHTEAQLEFFTGQTAMIFCGSWLKSEMQGKIPPDFRLGAFNLPIVDADKADPNAIFTGTGYYFVMKNSRHPEIGADFLRFMTSREMAGTFAQMRDITVAVEGVMEGRVSEDMHDLIDLTRRATTTYGTAPGEGFPEMNQPINDVRFKVMNGEMTPAEGAQALEAAALAVRTRAENPDRTTVRHVWKPALLLGLLGLGALYWLYTILAKLRASRRASTQSRVRLRWGGVLFFVGPAAALYTIFVILPSLKSFIWSLNRWDGLTEMTFVGLLHFKRLLLESDEFWIGLSNNLFIMFAIPLFVLPLSLFLAVCISRQVRGAQLFKIVFFFPNILGGVAATLLWMHLYNPQGGPVNSVLTTLGKIFSVLGIELLAHWFHGFEGFAWLAQDNLYWALVPMSIWGACGFNMILFLAAMESIPQSMYEAADIDGASVWRQFWSITLPLIWEILSISIVFMVIGGMKAFEVIWLLTNQAPVTENHVIGTRMVQAMFQEFKVGEATAIAVLLFLMVFFGTVTTLRLMKRETVEF